ncbi:hypothetical protein PR048_012870 [Dryococelus australis]|uniref:Uncharacterized protein n=1 Tax=Dryococelus australis TaxID=614101 RepID=A0ABQ9HS17_9NEOP|nr:hypothetical protein PR048_012870 [Dryococelus australis]
MLTNASNHGHVKLLTILVTYATVNLQTYKSMNDSCVKIQTKLFDLIEIGGYSAEILSQSSLLVIKKLDQESLVVAISRDNTNINFGGLKLKGINCVFSISFTVKMCGYFHIFAVRVEWLKEFGEFVGQEYRDIPSYSNSFFLFEEKCPAVIKMCFSDPCTQLWVDGKNTAVETCVIPKNLQDKLKIRKEEHFVPASVKKLITSLEECGSFSRSEFF